MVCSLNFSFSPSCPMSHSFICCAYRFWCVSSVKAEEEKILKKSKYQPNIRTDCSRFYSPQGCSCKARPWTELWIWFSFSIDFAEDFEASFKCSISFRWPWAVTQRINDRAVSIVLGKRRRLRRNERWDCTPKIGHHTVVNRRKR